MMPMTSNACAFMGGIVPPMSCYVSTVAAPAHRLQRVCAREGDTMRVISFILLWVLGFALLMAGVVSKYIWIGVAGFALLLAAVLVATWAAATRGRTL